MLPKSFFDAITAVQERLRDQTVLWAVCGSASLALQGMDVQAHDLDIVTGVESLEVFTEAFRKETVSSVRKVHPLHRSTPDYYELELRIKGVNVQVCGEYDHDVHMRRMIEGKTSFVAFEGPLILCLTLAAEADAYEEMGRLPKAQAIREFLRSA